MPLTVVAALSLWIDLNPLCTSGHCNFPPFFFAKGSGSCSSWLNGHKLSATPEHYHCSFETVCVVLWLCTLGLIVLLKNSQFSCRLHQLFLQDFSSQAFQHILPGNIPTALSCHHHAYQWDSCFVIMCSFFGLHQTLYGLRFGVIRL